MEIKLTAKNSLIAVAAVILFVIIRIATISSSEDPDLEKAVRDVLWSTYSGVHLSKEIEAIRQSGNFDEVEALTKKSSSEAIDIIKISRSEPILSFSTNQKVIVKVRYYFPGDQEARTDYMKFTHGSLVNVWSYQYSSSAYAYYMNFY